MKIKYVFATFVFVLLFMISVGHAFNPALFNYRVPIKLTTSPANVTNINIWLNVTYRTGMDADFNNLRFTWLNTTSGQEQEIPFWKESYVAGKYAIIWLKVPQINGTVYMYYDNVTTLPADVLANNGSETFIVYSKLDSLTGWTTYIGTNCKALDINSVRFGYPVVEMNVSYGTGTASEWCIISKDVPLPSSFKIDVDTYSNNIADTLPYYNGYSGPFYVTRFDMRGAGFYDKLGYYPYGATSTSAIATTTISSPADTWLHMQVIRFANGTWQLRKGGGLTTLGTLEATGTNTSTTSGGIALTGDGATGSTYFKNLFVEAITSQQVVKTLLTAQQIGIIVATNVENRTYYGSNILISFNATSGVDYNCTLYLNGNEIAEINQSTNYTATKVLPGGFYNFTYYCINTLGVTNTKSIYFYVWDGVNLTAILNDTGERLAWFNLSATNGTDTVSFTNTTGLIEYNKLPQGNVQFTLDDAHANLYYYPAVFNLTINATEFYNKDVYLKPKPSNIITLWSSAGWSITQGQATSVSCDVAQGTPSLFVDKVLVPNPYAFYPSLGSHYVVCSVGETPLYRPTNKTQVLLVNPPFRCLTNDTYAFEKTISVSATGIYTINMTALVKEHYVKKDLSDVKVVNVSNVWVNTTNGYYVIVNATNLSFSVYFGNYLANTTYKSHALTSNVLQISLFEQIHPIIEVRLKDEMTGEPLYPENATVYMIVDCPAGENYIPIHNGDTHFIIPELQYATKATIRVQYTADAYYSRSLFLKPYDHALANFYVVDAFKHALDRITFVITDINHYDSTLVVYKIMDNQTIIITEGKFDQSHEFSAYLVEDTTYHLELLNPDGTVTQLGIITVFQPGTKEIGANTFTFAPNSVTIAKTITMNAYTKDNRTDLVIYYKDAKNETEKLNIKVFFENGTLFKEFNYANASDVELNVNISNFSNESFTVLFNATTKLFDIVSQSVDVLAPFTVMPGTTNPLWLNLFALTIVLFVAGLTTKFNFIEGSVIGLIVILLLKAIGWLTLSGTAIAFIIMLIIIGIAYHLRQNEIQGGY